MTKTVHIDDTLFHSLSLEMARVDTLRLKLNMDSPIDVLEEFLMRRALLRAKFFMHQQNKPEALRMWKLLMQFRQT